MARETVYFNFSARTLGALNIFRCETRISDVVTECNNLYLFLYFCLGFFYVFLSFLENEPRLLLGAFLPNISSAHYETKETEEKFILEENNVETNAKGRVRRKRGANVDIVNTHDTYVQSKEQTKDFHGKLNTNELSIDRA